jgi:hypothetical protein
MKKVSRLDSLYIAKPCPAEWEKMTGDDTVRSCSLCSKDVYNISNMTKDEAEALLVKHGVSVCMGFFRRSDGTIMTDDCPVGLRAFRKCFRQILRMVAAIAGLVLSTTNSYASDDKTENGSAKTINIFGFGSAENTELGPLAGFGVPAFNNTDQIKKSDSPGNTVPTM